MTNRVHASENINRTGKFHLAAHHEICPISITTLIVFIPNFNATSARIVYTLAFKTANGSGQKLFETNLLMPEDMAFISRSKSMLITCTDVPRKKLL